MSAIENQQLVAEVRSAYPQASYIIVGLTAPEGTNASDPATWQWLSTNLTTPYQNWGAGQPQALTTQSQCGLVEVSSGTWRSYACQQEVPNAVTACQIGESPGDTLRGY